MDSNTILNTLNHSTRVDECKEAIATLYLNLNNDPNHLVLVGNMRKLFSGLKKMLTFSSNDQMDAIGKSYN